MPYLLDSLAIQHLAYHGVDKNGNKAIKPAPIDKQSAKDVQQSFTLVTTHSYDEFKRSNGSCTAISPSSCSKTPISVSLYVA
jgi:hypothetical protein